MADFTERLAQLRALTDGENPAIPVDIVTDLEAHFQSTVTALDGATVRITERDKRISSQESEIARLKGENYDLSIRGTNEPPNEDPKVLTPSQTGIAGLFDTQGKLK